MDVILSAEYNLTARGRLRSSRFDLTDRSRFARRRVRRLQRKTNEYTLRPLRLCGGHIFSGNNTA
jgi:hypothetical protein